MSIQKIRIGITMGDPSGIGPEIIAKSLKSLDRACEYVIIGDRKVFERACQCVKLHVLKCQNVRVSGSDVRFVDLNNVNARRFSFGKTKAEYGKASIEYLDKALSLIDNQEIDCLVTCPISKEAINKAGYTYSGHTEYLQKKNSFWFCRNDAFKYKA